MFPRLILRELTLTLLLPELLSSRAQGNLEKNSRLRIW